ncbi:MAG TPA: PaaI family thioesterase [Mycobacteriales bacterium]|nr:PaaI family thioesterase [Mycobacteriales bacterium]
MTQPSVDPAEVGELWLEVENGSKPIREGSRQHILGQLGMYDVAADGCDLAMELPLRPQLANSRGGLQGGLLATLVDIVAGRAAIASLPPGYSAATSDMNLHFMSAVTVGPARAEATVLRQGKRMCVVRVEVYDGGRDDKWCATATTTFVVLELRDGQLDLRGPLPRRDAE